MRKINISAADRLAIFIDNNNLRVGSGADGIYTRVDYVTLIDTLAEGREIMTVHVHDSYRYNEDGSRNTNVLNYLTNIGCIPFYRDSYDAVNKVQKEIDTSMSLDIYDCALQDLFDTAIIVSGDGDFVPVSERLAKLGKNVEVAAFSGCISNRLKERGRFWNLSSMPIIEFVTPTYQDIAFKEEAVPYV